MRFESTRKAHFINMDAEILYVEYGQEKRTEILPNGLACTFDGKVRIRLGKAGKHHVLYQAISASGVRYLSKDKQFEFFEKGPYCLLNEKGRLIFEGVYCRE